MIWLGLLLIAAGVFVMLCGIGADRDSWRTTAAALLAFGTLCVVLALDERQRERIDEIWKQLDVHVRDCQCMTREYEVPR